MDICITSPDYDPSSGGIRVLHYFGYLCHRAGHRVRMSCSGLNTDWGLYSDSQLRNYDFVMLPEIYQPISFKNVVRWVLYFPGKICNGPTTYPDNEMVVSYCHEYDESAKIAANGRDIVTFYLPYSNMDGAHSDIKKNIEGVVWYGKGRPKTIPPEVEGLPVITRSWPMPRANLLMLLNTSKTFYSFDRHTSLNNEALICGCDVQLWDGEKFERYMHQTPYDNVMVIDRDMADVQKFLVEVKNYFGI